jgi:putative addiction module component
MSTATTLPLNEMSRTAKLRLMEELWDDLCHSSEGVTSTAWHGEVLAARTQRVANGEDEFLEWAEVKERLLRKKS